jgi:multidrug efflux pump subunit AcrA (membrane-fusion protein)
MKRINFLLWMIIAAGILLFASSCGGRSAQPTSTLEPEAETEFNPVVSATGVIVPSQWVRLSAAGAGIVEEVLVQEDETVEKGDILVRLVGAEKLEAAIAAASFEQAAAQRALDDLYQDPELRLAQANQAVVDARLAIRDAERRVKNLSTASSQADIDQARATVSLVKDKLDKARKDYKPYANKPEDNLTRAALLNRKAQAEQVHDAAVRRLNNLLGVANELDLSEAESDLELAQAQLFRAEHDAEMYQKGPDPADIALAEKRLANAKAQLAAAEAALDDLLVTAPFAGSVSELNIHLGEWAAPGQNLLLLADLGHMRIETTDLSEIDVARIQVGDPVKITFDALPDVATTGKISRISSKAAQGAGVNYTVVIEFDEFPETLRWGMTAFVDIEVE